MHFESNDGFCKCFISSMQIRGSFDEIMYTFIKGCWYISVSLNLRHSINVDSYSLNHGNEWYIKLFVIGVISVLVMCLLFIFHFGSTGVAFIHVVSIGSISFFGIL